MAGRLGRSFPATRRSAKVVATDGAGVTDLTLTPGTPNVAWTGSTPAVLIDRTLAPGTPNVAWTGSTPSVVVDRTLTPGTATVAWTGSTPAVVVDKTLTPGTAVVAWTGTTPAVQVDRTLTPGTPNVAWTGSTPAVTVDKTLSPGVAVVAWSGSTPSIVTDGSITLTPGTAVVAWTGSTPGIQVDETVVPGSAIVAWSGSTPSISVVPDAPVVTPEPPPSTGGGDGGSGFDDGEDFSTVEVTNLTLRPGTPAIVAWSGSRSRVLVVEAPVPFRFKLPGRRREATPVPAAPLPVVNRTLTPGGAVVAYSGSSTSVQIESFVPIQDYEDLKARVAELELEREEEMVILAALSSG